MEKIELNKVLDIVEIITKTMSSAVTPTQEKVSLLSLETALSQLSNQIAGKTIVRENASKSRFLTSYNEYMYYIKKFDELPILGEITDVLQQIASDIDYWK